MYKLIQSDRQSNRHVAIMQCLDTNAVLRFVAEDNSLVGVAPDTHVALQVVRFDNTTKTVICRMCEPAPSPPPKRLRF